MEYYVNCQKVIDKILGKILKKYTLKLFKIYISFYKG